MLPWSAMFWDWCLVSRDLVHQVIVGLAVEQTWFLTVGNLGAHYLCKTLAPKNVDCSFLPTNGWSSFSIFSGGSWSKSQGILTANPTSQSMSNQLGVQELLAISGDCWWFKPFRCSWADGMGRRFGFQWLKMLGPVRLGAEQCWVGGDDDQAGLQGLAKIWLGESLACGWRWFRYQVWFI